MIIHSLYVTESIFWKLLSSIGNTSLLFDEFVRFLVCLYTGLCCMYVICALRYMANYDIITINPMMKIINSRNPPRRANMKYIEE